jgi:hypothetical protein
VVVQQPKPEKPTFTLQAPEALTLWTGKEGTIALHIGARNFDDESVQLTFPNLPAGVTVPDYLAAPLGKGDTTVDVPLKVGPAAAAGTTTLTVLALGKDGVKRDATLKLTVLWLPPKFEPSGAKTVTDLDGKTYFDRIHRDFGRGLKPEFVLIPRKKAADSPTFYLMVDKVTVALFKEFLAKTKAPVHAGWNAEAEDAYPVFNVRVEDAHRFAEWLHGRLPSPREWDKAAGFYDRDGREGPFQGKWGGANGAQVAVRRKEPEKAGASRSDASVFGGRDMAGNGWEWTNQVEPGDRRVPLKSPRPAGDQVQLRGNSYQAREPLLFSKLDRGETAFPTCPYQLSLPDLSFRVAIEAKP